MGITKKCGLDSTDLSAGKANKQKPGAEFEPVTKLWVFFCS